MKDVMVLMPIIGSLGLGLHDSEEGKYVSRVAMGDVSEMRALHPREGMVSGARRTLRWRLLKTLRGGVDVGVGGAANSALHCSHLRRRGPQIPRTKRDFTVEPRLTLLGNGQHQDPHRGRGHQVDLVREGVPDVLPTP